MASVAYQCQTITNAERRAYGLVSLIQALNEAIELREVGDQVAAVSDALIEAARHPEFLPAAFREPVAERYARRPLYIDPAGRFSVLVMVWSKGQGTPLHDHGGKWVVECLLEGKVRVGNYRYAGMVDGLHEFELGDVQCELAGDVSYRIPPEEHHILQNDQDEPSVTIHVFGGILDACDVFEPVPGGYRKVRRSMSYTA